MSAIILSKVDDLLKLQSVLKGYLPRSLRLCAEVAAVSSGVLSREFVVNRWPHFTVVMCRQGARKTTNEIAYTSNVCSLFTMDMKDCEEFLKQPGIIDTSKRTFMAAVVSADGTDSLMNVFCGAKLSVVSKSTLMTLCQFTSMLTLDDKLGLHEGYYFRRLTTDDANEVNNNWEYGCAESKAFIEMQLKSFPSFGVCATGDDVQLVAFCVCQWYGALGMLWVKNEHRHRGIASALVARMTNELLELGRPVWSIVEASNDASARLFRKMEAGMDKVKYEWITIEPAVTDKKQHNKKCC